MNTMTNTVLETLEADHEQMKEWFEHMHRNPELSMRERETARYIADIVRQWGYDVEAGVGLGQAQDAHGRRHVEAAAPGA